MATATHVPPGSFPPVVTLKIVKRDEFSTKCNQTDHHRMSGGRQEVSPGVGGEAVERHSRGRLPFLVGTVGLGRAREGPSFGITALPPSPVCAACGPPYRNIRRFCSPARPGSLAVLLRTVWCGACPRRLREAASPCAVRGSEGCSGLLSSLRGPGGLGF